MRVYVTNAPAGGLTLLDLATVTGTAGAHHQRLGLGDEFRRKQTCDRPYRVVADAQLVAGRTWRLSRVVRRVAAGGAPVAIRVRADVRRAAFRAARTRTLVLKVRATATAANGATRTRPRRSLSGPAEPHRDAPTSGVLRLRTPRAGNHRHQTGPRGAKRG